MKLGKFDPQQFFERPDAVALLVPSAELFGFLKRSLDLPPQWAALVTRTTGDRTVVPPGGEVIDDGIEEVLLARISPVDVALEEEAIVTRDRFQCRVTLRLRLSLTAERGGLTSFLTAVLGSHRAATSASLARYLQPTMRAALATFAGEHSADELIDGTAGIAAAVAEAAEAPCFRAGLLLEGTPAVQFESQTLLQVREAREDAARRRQEHEAADQVRQALERAQTEHLDHLTSLLVRLGELAQRSPDVELPDLVRTFSEQERGEVYGAIFASQTPTSNTGWIVVAAGDELIFFDPRDLAAPRRRLKVGGEAGPVRSIQTERGADGKPVLLLGAATGLYRLPVDEEKPDLTLLAVEGAEIRGGFNSVALVGSRVWASHSELGLYEWSPDEGATGRARFASMTRGAKAVRNVQFCDGDLFCSIDDRIICWPADESLDRPSHIYAGSSSTITAVCATPDAVFAGNSDGEVLRWNRKRDNAPERLHGGSRRPAESVWVLCSHGVRRLVYTDTSMQVHARVLGDSFTCRYEAGGQTVRRVEVAADIIVATNDLRDRLIWWTPGMPGKAAGTIGVSALCGHSIQDVALVPGVVG